METKFTPGPWKVFQNSAGQWQVNCMGDSDDSHCNISNYSPTVAEAWSVTYGKHENRNPEANIHLISASPEMYEELQEVSNWLNTQLGMGDWHSDIEKLLAKARGENG